MYSLYYIVTVLLALIAIWFAYNAGYKMGAKKVLNEWKDWINNKCRHGDDWDSCPDCRH
jgi:hypothetical protein